MAANSVSAASVGNMISSFFIPAQNRVYSCARQPRIFTSTDPSHVDVLHLRDLLSSANLSCHRFPILDAKGSVEPVDPHKLRVALFHSSVVVSVFSKQILQDESPTSAISFPFSVGFPWSTSSGRGQLVGFGRAVSDNGLTASIHDVVVLPSLQGLGIGKRIVNKITSVLTRRGIYDISALCSENERLFFQSCGFGEDILESTTMIYTKTTSQQNNNGDQIVVSAGRKILLVPPLKKPSHLN